MQPPCTSERRWRGSRLRLGVVPPGYNRDDTQGSRRRSRRRHDPPSGSSRKRLDPLGGSSDGCCGKLGSSSWLEMARCWRSDFEYCGGREVSWLDAERRSSERAGHRRGLGSPAATSGPCRGCSSLSSRFTPTRWPSSRASSGSTLASSSYPRRSRNLMSLGYVLGLSTCLPRRPH
jgi:hypothetical protein